MRSTNESCSQSETSRIGSEPQPEPSGKCRGRKRAWLSTGPPKKRSFRVLPSRALRVDLTGLSAAKSKELLAEFDVVIRSETRALRLRRCAAYAGGLGAEDFDQIARLAVFEAYKTFDAARAPTLRAWVKKMVRWRLREFLSVVLSINDFEQFVDDTLRESGVGGRRGRSGRNPRFTLRGLLDGW